MKIVEEISLIRRGNYAQSGDWKVIRTELFDAIRRVDWPPGSGKFTIYPESGKKPGQGNGVTPIKNGLMAELQSKGWAIESRAKNAAGKVFGEFDAALLRSGPVVLEWETGNISSSHRSINKMALFLQECSIAVGVLVVPSKKLAYFLTDRIGNISELERYFPYWKKTPCDQGVLEIAVIEHDAESTGVPRIPKGTDGRARA